MLFAAKDEKETIPFFIVLDVGKKKLIGAAGETGRKPSLPDPAVEHILRSDPEGLRVQGFAGFIIQDEVERLDLSLFG